MSIAPQTGYIMKQYYNPSIFLLRSKRKNRYYTNNTKDMWKRIRAAIWRMGTPQTKSLYHFIHITLRLVGRVSQMDGSFYKQLVFEMKITSPCKCTTAVESVNYCLTFALLYLCYPLFSLEETGKSSLCSYTFERQTLLIIQLHDTNLLSSHIYFSPVNYTLLIPQWRVHGSIQRPDVSCKSGLLGSKLRNNAHKPSVIKRCRWELTSLFLSCYAK